MYYPFVYCQPYWYLCTFCSVAFVFSVSTFRIHRDSPAVSILSVLRSPPPYISPRILINSESGFCLPVVACFIGLVFSFLMVHKIMEHSVTGSLLNSGNVVFTIQLMPGSISKILWKTKIKTWASCPHSKVTPQWVKKKKEVFFPQMGWAVTWTGQASGHYTDN